MKDNVTSIRTATQLLSRMPIEQMLCRGNYHPWPVLEPGKRVPRGYRATVQRDGCYQITEVCPRCKSTRTSTTLPGGASDPQAIRTIVHPEDWVVLPRDLENRPTKRDLHDDAQTLALQEHFGSAS
jgi:hypothetical protein